MCMVTLFGLCSSMGFWSRISSAPASSVIILFLVKQAKGSLLEKTTTGWNKYKQACLKMLQESTVDTGKETSSTIKQRAKCWGTNEHMGIWWIIRGPMLFSIAVRTIFSVPNIVNFGIFLKILRMLISKLKAQQMSFHDYKYRLARSTLVLIPLLGIHEFVFTFITDEQVEGLSRHIRLFIQLTMSSFHGFFVAVLYCFANGE
ncbi:hypothetical protein Q9233_013988, partial [Columba guinea]